jgi:sensor domain CHASE-containing protein
MKQYDKILPSIIPLSILCVVVQTASLVGLFQFFSGNIEKCAVRKYLQFSTDALQTELNRIGGVAFEWSAWDDTGLFIEGKNPSYLQANMTENTLREQNLNVICILDSQGKLICNRCVKASDKEMRNIDLSLFSPENLRKNPALWNHRDPNSCVTGCYSTEGGVLMLSSRPVTNSKNTGPVRGAVIMGRFITEDFIASITKQPCLDFYWWSLRTDYTKNALGKYLSKITDENRVYIESSFKTTTAYTVLPDIDGKDAVLIKFVMANEFSPYKEGLLAKCIGIYAIEGFIFLVYLASFANKYCGNCRQQTIHDTQSALAKERLSSNKSTKRKTLIRIP